MGILNCNCITWMHHLDSNEALELHKDTEYCFEQILKAALQQNIITYLLLTNNPRKMNKTC